MEKVNKYLSENPGADIEPSNKFIDFIKYKFEPVIEYFMYILGIIIIFAGSINSIVIFFVEKKKSEKNIDHIIAKMRVQLAEAISLGLTFILAAEVIKTFRVPNLFQLIKIVMLVLLRQIITWFLDKDVERLRKNYSLQ